MICAIIGDVGNWKTLSIVRNIKINKHKFAFTNFETKDLPNVIRLKKDDIVLKYEEKKEGQKISRTKFRVNWEFWEDTQQKFKSYDIYLDEIHRIFPHRRGMSQFSICGIEWLTQIRKILNDGKNNIYFISQALEHIDVSFRRLLYCIFYTQKIEKIDKNGNKQIYIKLYTFLTKNNVSAEQRFRMFISGYHSWSIPIRVIHANSYFKYYNTLQIVRGDGDYL